MSTPEEKRERRAAFMVLLCELTDGDTNAEVDRDDLRRRLGWTSEEVDRVEEYLEAEELVATLSLGGGVSITHIGVVEVEEALLHQEQPTEHFAPGHSCLRRW
jgi:hypothetical protein